MGFRKGETVRVVSNKPIPWRLAEAPLNETSTGVHSEYSSVYSRSYTACDGPSCHLCRWESEGGRQLNTITMIEAYTSSIVKEVIDPVGMV